MNNTSTASHLSFYTMDDFDFENKRVLLRVDINSPIDPKTNRILDDTRIKSGVSGGESPLR